MMLGLLFALIACLYAIVGFGGGSSYLALLVLWGIPYSTLPMIALLCNISVVSGNSFHYIRAGFLNWRLLLTTAIPSVPFAYIGGRLKIDQFVFLALLFVALLASGLRLLLNYRRYDDNHSQYRTLPFWIGASIGCVLGFLAGVVGIGGGIFLAPLLYNLRAASPKQIATTASLFILLNSFAGLVGQLQKNGMNSALIDYWYLPLFAFLGGQLGNQLTLRWIPTRIIALLTAVLVLLVSTRLGLMIIAP